MYAAVLDASVLVPNPLCDTLLRMAERVVPPRGARVPATYRSYRAEAQTSSNSASTTWSPDERGNVVRADILTNYDAFTANGHTLTDRDTYTRTLCGDGTMRDAGLTVHVQGADGQLITRCRPDRLQRRR